MRKWLLSICVGTALFGSSSITPALAASKQCDQFRLETYSYAEGLTVPTTTWVRWTPGMGQVIADAGPQVEPLTPIPGIWGDSFSSSSARNLVSPSGRLKAFGVGLDRIVTVKGSGVVSSIQLDQTGQLFGWLDDEHLVVTGQDLNVSSPSARHQILRIANGRLESTWAISIEPQPPSPVISVALGISRSGAEFRFFFNTPIGGTQSVGISGDQRAEVNAERTLPEIDSRYLKKIDSAWGLVDRKGRFTRLTTTEHMFGRDEPWFHLEPSGKRAVLAFEDRLVVWDRKTLKHREYLFLGQLSYTSSQRDRIKRYEIVWAHGGLIGYGVGGAFFVSSAGKQFKFGPDVLFYALDAQPIARPVTRAVVFGPRCRSTRL